MLNGEALLRSHSAVTAKTGAGPRGGGRVFGEKDCCGRQYQRFGKRLGRQTSVASDTRVEQGLAVVDSKASVQAYGLAANMETI